MNAGPWANDERCATGRAAGKNAQGARMARVRVDDGRRPRDANVDRITYESLGDARPRSKAGHFDRRCDGLRNPPRGKAVHGGRMSEVRHEPDAQDPIAMRSARRGERRPTSARENLAARKHLSGLLGLEERVQSALRFAFARPTP